MDSLASDPNPIEWVSTAAYTIPAISLGPVTEDSQPVLLWVHTGAALVSAGGIEHVLSAGQALWVPPGVEHRMRTEPGSVVIPMFPRLSDHPDLLGKVAVASIPSGWTDWLIHQWDDNSHTSAEVPGSRALLDLVAHGSATAGATPLRAPTHGPRPCPDPVKPWMSPARCCVTRAAGAASTRSPPR